MKKYYFICTLFCFFALCVSQNTRVIDWSGIDNYNYNDTLITLLDFQNSVYYPEFSSNKVYFERIPINFKNVSFEISVTEFSILDEKEKYIISKKA